VDATTRIIEALNGSRLTESETAQARRMLEMTVDRRLRPMEVTLEEASRPEFIRNLARCDDLQSPIVRAARLCYEDVTLGAITPFHPENPRGDMKLLGADQTLLLYTQPPNLELVVELATRAKPERIFVNLSFVMQRKSLTRQPAQRHVAIFSSGNRLRPSGEAHMQATLQDIPATAKDPYFSFSTKPGSYQRLDYDFQDALMRDEQLGCRARRQRDPFFAKLVQEAKASRKFPELNRLTQARLKTVPWHYPPL
jgi:hypothetical protein